MFGRDRDRQTYKKCEKEEASKRRQFVCFACLLNMDLFISLDPLYAMFLVVRYVHGKHVIIFFQFVLFLRGMAMKARFFPRDIACTCTRTRTCGWVAHCDIDIGPD